VRFLADDLLEGRYPGLRGGELAAKYIATEFALDGLKPAGDDGTYFQQVKFVGVKAEPAKTSFTFVPLHGATRGATARPGETLRPIPLTYADDYTVSNQAHTPSVSIDAPLVFVGFGVTAPEYNWDDYAGVDVKGKVVVVIVGDPPSNDPKFFGGRALTYYGRWTYKFEQAARMGAVGCLIIHRTDYASYGWDVVKNSNTSEKTYLADDANAKLEAASWIQLEVARKLFAASGLNLDEQMKAASTRGFKAVALPFALDAHVESTIRPFESANVVGMVPGADAAAKSPAVLFTAHYDHLGFKAGMPGDNIYNGAADNGTGSGMLLELARAWATITPPHDVIFAAVTAEEQGLLGSEYLGQHPPIPAKDIALDINFDMILPVGIPQEINVNGAQRTNFYPTVEQTAQQFGLTIVPDPRPEAGSYYRSDHFSLSRVGIPAFSVDPGMLYEGHDRAWGEAVEKDYNDNRYHNFSDNYTPSMDFRGDAKLARFGMQVAWRALTDTKPIEWNKGDEFAAARLASER
jgi:Zn-dependent M28 family amino/carboxypeptidase